MKSLLNDQGKTAKTTIRCDPELHAQFKSAAALAKMSLEAWALNALNVALGKPSAPPPPEKGLLADLSPAEKVRVARYIELLRNETEFARELAAVADRRIRQFLQLVTQDPIGVNDPRLKKHSHQANDPARDT